jgi:ubiquinone/menaquinone biosynthesis C-methylase UbiE
MSDKTYYERYWKQEVKGGVMNEPATWTMKNLDWHYNFFHTYIGKKVLDVGGGEGTFLDYISHKKKTVKDAVVAELSDEAIKIGKKKHPKLEFKQGSIEDLSYPDETFDTVFAIEVVEHLLDVDRCLYQIHRVMKKGGYFCMTTTDFNLPKKIIIAAFFWDKFFYPNNPHIRFYTKNSLQAICETHGFKLADYRWNLSYFGLMPKGQMMVVKKV